MTNQGKLPRFSAEVRARAVRMVRRILDKMKNLTYHIELSLLISHNTKYQEIVSARMPLKFIAF